MSTSLLEKKDEWLNEEFFKKLATNPKLAKAFANPQYMAAFTEFG